MVAAVSSRVQELGGNIASLSLMRATDHSRGYLVARVQGVGMDELARHLADDRVVVVDVREVAEVAESDGHRLQSRPQIGECRHPLQSMASRSCRVIVLGTRSRRRQIRQAGSSKEGELAASASSDGLSRLLPCESRPRRSRTRLGRRCGSPEWNRR